MKHRTINDILAITDIPVVAIDSRGIITFINKVFEDAYGWNSEELVGQVITTIMPPQMRDAHNFGFSRFLVSEEARILNTPLVLPLFRKDGTTVEAEHYITGEKSGGSWRFAATITPKSEAV